MYTLFYTVDICTEAKTLNIFPQLHMLSVEGWVVWSMRMPIVPGKTAPSGVKLLFVLGF